MLPRIRYVIYARNRVVSGGSGIHGIFCRRDYFPVRSVFPAVEIIFRLEKKLRRPISRRNYHHYYHSSG